MSTEYTGPLVDQDVEIVLDHRAETIAFTINGKTLVCGQPSRETWMKIASVALIIHARDRSERLQSG